MTIGTITCTYFMRIYGYKMPEGFDWGAMCDKYRAEFGIAEFMKLAAEIRKIGFNAMEIWEPMFSNKIYNLETAKKVAADLRAMGFESLAYCIGGYSAKDVPNIDSAYQFAKAMGCEVVVGCVIKDDVPVVMPALQAAGEKYGLYYAVENHPVPNLATPDEVESATRPYSRVGANIDTGLYNMMGFDAVEAAELLKGKIFHCHFKEMARGGHDCLPIGDADTPCAELLKWLAENDYPHMVSVEFEYDGDPTPGLSKSLGYIGGVNRALAL